MEQSGTTLPLLEAHVLCKQAGGWCAARWGWELGVPPGWASMLLVPGLACHRPAGSPAPQQELLSVPSGGSGVCGCLVASPHRTILREIIGLELRPIWCQMRAGVGDVSTPGPRGCHRGSCLGGRWEVVCPDTCSCPQGVGKARATSCSASRRRTGRTTHSPRALSW